MYYENVALLRQFFEHQLDENLTKKTVHTLNTIWYKQQWSKSSIYLLKVPSHIYLLTTSFVLQHDMVMNDIVNKYVGQNG